jgi:hypothetical protein
VTCLFLPVVRQPAAVVGGYDNAERFLSGGATHRRRDETTLRALMRPGRLSGVHHGFAWHPSAGSAPPSCQSVRGCRRARWSPESAPTPPGPPPSEALSVPGDDGLRLATASGVRYRDQNRATMTQSHRSGFASQTRPGRVRGSTSSWCRRARISRWSAARDRAKVRSVSRCERRTETMAERGTHCGGLDLCPR